MISIVIVAYNRPQSLRRLLDSLSSALYDGNSVDLIISIDKGQKQEEIADIARSFNWNSGEKHIRVLNENYGLRKHVLTCGDLVSYYDSIIMLEDDITVSVDFYLYIKKAVDFFANNDKIAGISLYAHKTALQVMRPFIPTDNGFDTYLMQFAQSWGQCWTKKMWQGFRAWYDEKEAQSFPNDGSVPAYIFSWNSASWLKYFMWYMAERDLYFVYPYVARSTNHSERGTHQYRESNDYMVPLSEGSMEFRFPTFRESARYDMYFERIGLQCDRIECEGKKICFDLYGTKTHFHNYDFLISTAPRAYQVMAEIALKYRPHELNCIIPEQGNGIFVYDLHHSAKPPKVDTYTMARYDLGPYSWKRTFLHGVCGFINAVLDKAGIFIMKLGQRKR